MLPTDSPTAQHFEETLAFDPENFSGTSKACASTLRRPLPKNGDSRPSNAELAQQRQMAMRSAFESTINKVYSGVFTIESADPSTYQNRSIDGEPTGTCGPKPPNGMGQEPWLIKSLSKSNPQLACNREGHLEKESLEDCLSRLAPEKHYLCNSEITDLNDRDAIDKKYAPFRKASITVHLTCKPLNNVKVTERQIAPVKKANAPQKACWPIDVALIKDRKKPSLFSRFSSHHSQGSGSTRKKGPSTSGTPNACFIKF